MKRGAPMRRTPLRSVSRKRQRENILRRAVLADLFPPGTMCVVPWCTRLADDAHEKLTRARGGSITDPDNIAPLCRPHHDEITFTEPAWAYELGLLVHSWDKETDGQQQNRSDENCPTSRRAPSAGRAGRSRVSADHSRVASPQAQGARRADRCEHDHGD